MSSVIAPALLGAQAGQLILHYRLELERRIAARKSASDQIREAVE